MEQIANKTNYTEELAELLDRLPEEKAEYVAAHLLGTVQGVMLAAEIEKDKKTA